MTLSNRPVEIQHCTADWQTGCDLRYGVHGGVVGQETKYWYFVQPVWTSAVRKLSLLKI